MFIVFNLAQLSIILMLFTEFAFLLAYFLKSWAFKILFIILTISKNSIFPFKNKSTNTSFAAFIIIGVEIPDEKHLLSKLIEGKILGFAFWKLRWVESQSQGTEEMATIAAHIRSGAMAFLNREYKVQSIFFHSKVDISYLFIS